MLRAGILSSQSYLQMKTLSAALEQSEEIMQWINASSCVVQRVLQFGVCWGLREVLLSRRSCPSFSTRASADLPKIQEAPAVAREALDVKLGVRGDVGRRRDGRRYQ